MKTLSSLATPFVPLRTLKTSPTTGKPYVVPNRTKERAFGLVVHTSGGGVPAMADRFARSGKDPSRDTPEEVAIWVYSATWSYFTHYLVVPSGKLYQVCDDRLRAPHCGFTQAGHRAACLDGSWRSKCAPAGVKLWDARWSPRKSPVHLYPSANPNDDYLGVELVPMLRPDKDGGRFTAAQYRTLGALVKDVSSRHGFEPKGNRLVGHEDLNPFSGEGGRWDKGGGWDPGALRVKPYFDWTRVGVG